MPVRTLAEPVAHQRVLAAVGYHLITWLPFAITGAGLLAVEALAPALGAAYDLPVGGLLVALFALRQLNGFVVTALYHRAAAHRSVDFHPALQLVLRLWGWLFLGLGLRTWAGVHRAHHAEADGPDAAFSPSRDGFWRIGRDTVAAHWAAVRDPERVARLVPDLPLDALERLVQADERRFFGVFGLRMPLLLGLVWVGMGLLGLPPLPSLLAAVSCVPSLTGAVLSTSLFLVNGLGHLVGYRRFDTADTSTNVVAIDVLTLGEALHNNHHARPGSACFAAAPGEIDGAWPLLLLLRRLGLVTALRGVQ